ncbi:Aminoacyl-tRNA hydrolase [Mucor velutinosus]|uniref:Aminoacyl-tRNA hydrolase n=1 Tax=Mucor velutinosus TaxID=708070 RepID=A0AAN7DB42_9FUNG|nr:Aminoacyl-tRNA hydrolase [Mucor velutinosus]
MKSFFLHKHRRKVIAVIISSVIITFICRHVYLSNAAAASNALQDLDLMSKFCNQRENWKPYQPLQLDSRKQPQWVPSNAAVDSIYMTERDHASHLYRDSVQPDLFMDDDVWDGLPVKGAFYMIVKNEELQSARSAIRSIEDRFNAHNNVSYPWVLLNSQQYTHDFKKYIRKVASGKVYFGQIDLKAFTYPEWIDVKRTENAIRRMISLRVQKSHSLYERQEMRYKAGLFQHHSLFNTVDYAWRVEPGSEYTCDMFQGDDPFQTMKANNKKMGFTITSKEDSATSFSLWPATLQFIRMNPQLITQADSSIMPWLLTKEREYNFCYMWSDFEIVDLAFLRSQEYTSFFHYLDLVGGFFYERWGDGPVRSIAAAMFLRKEDVHFFNEVGYSRSSIQHCPLSKSLLETCSCDYMDNYNFNSNSCTMNLLKIVSPQSINDIYEFAKSIIGERL